MLRLISPLPPSVNHYLAYRAVLRNGKPSAMSYKTKEAVKYQSAFAGYVAEEVKRQGYILPPDKNRHFYIDAVFYFDRIDRDPNNYFKCMLDAITDTGLVWCDDNVACERVQRVYYDPENPRVELTVYPTGYIGVFDDAKQAAAFADRCAHCKRYGHNCSIFHKAMGGRVQEDVVKGVCKKFSEKKDGKEYKDDGQGIC